MTSSVNAFRDLVLLKIESMIQEHSQTVTHCRAQGRYADAAYAEAQEKAVRKVLEEVGAVVSVEK